jgi:hypothetical protein
MVAAEKGSREPSLVTPIGAGAAYSAATARRAGWRARTVMIAIVAR